MSAPASAEFWDRVAEKYARDPVADQDAYDYTLGRMKAVLSSGDRVLELGAGTSSTAIELAPHVERYLSTDISPEMVRIGRGKATGIPNLDIEVAAGEHLRETQYDAVLALNLIHLVPDVERTLSDIADAVRSGGLFISKTGCLGDAPLWKRAMFRLFIRAMAIFGKAPETVHFLTGSDLAARIERAGFEIVEAFHDVSDAPRSFYVARRL